jgi:CPA2 family monovalent cation:H+ antiporter-2
MPHSTALITTIAVGLGLALVLGFIAVRLKLPALVGYLVAGILVGPPRPGFVADVGLAGQLAEIGVMLLMFGVGLHFSVDDLLSVRRIALPEPSCRSSSRPRWAWRWHWRGAGSLGAGIVFGLALSVASTVVLLRALENHGLLESVNGKIAVGWLVVEDLVMVLVLVMLPALSGIQLEVDLRAHPQDLMELASTLMVTLGQVLVFVALMLVVGRRLFPWLLWQVARTGSRELFTLCVIAACGGPGLRLGGALRRLLRPRSLLRWHGIARVRPQLPCGRRNRCRSGMRSRCCSSSRSACCSIPRSCWNSRRTC